MSKPVITVEDLGKAYYLGQSLDRHATFREMMAGLGKGVATRLRQKFTDVGKSNDAFWAMRHANFHVNRGEVLGLIGRNGAGKSTILKLLSRITEPTEGKATIRGRVASLEVGTGFHPELTGRENIFLNGAILGMSRAEINRKFDEIVAFSEVEKFLDTPVKRYSSGMYVRLAFAVAAHLEPEVLIVDEVLAVGDQAFQKKCLGKMGDVVRHGRTVLFVSHNMDAIQHLCTHAILCKGGVASDRMTPEEAVHQYLALSNEDFDIPLTERPRICKNPGRPRVFTALKIHTNTGHDRVVTTGGQVTFEIEISNCADVPSATCGIALCNNRGQRVALFHTSFHSGFWFAGADKACLTCMIPSLPLVPATYHIELVMADERDFIEKLERADKLEVVFADILGTGKIPNHNQGLVVLPCDWEVDGTVITRRAAPQDADEGEDVAEQKLEPQMR